MISDVAWSAWAKSYPRGQFVRVEKYLPLVQHMSDSGAVAGHLWDSWLPPAVRASISAALGQADARGAVQLLAGVHDIGKLSPVFATQVPSLATPMKAAGLPFASNSHTLGDRRELPHSLASHAAVERWLTGTHGWDRAAAQSVAIIPGSHHGVHPSDADINRARRSHDLLGDGLWQTTRDELLDHFAERYGVAAFLSARRPVPQHAQVLLTAIVIVSDWIASSNLFPLIGEGLGPEHLAPSEARSRHAWDGLALPAPWTPSPDRSQGADDLLRARFRVPDGATARPVQHATLDAARAMDRPGLLVVEAETGIGKTEAALLAAEELAARFGLGGVAMYLPTQATTDAMFARIMTWLDTLPGGSIDDADDAARTVMLMHGKSTLNPTFRDLRDVAGDWSPWDELTDDVARLTPGTSARAIVHEWLLGPKRAALADFVTGTIDQFLFLALKARHLPLRHLGAARKVIVLDEIHAADAYMNVFMLRALEWCGALGVPVIALSATLPRAQRDDLHAAYARGVAACDSAPVPRRAAPWKSRAAREAPVAPEHDDAQAALDTAYPIVTASSGGAITSTPVAASDRRSTTRLEVAPDDGETLRALLDDALADGGCALVVRNTVSRAQATYRELRDAYGDDVRLMHSRFIGHHRQANDAWLRATFGPPGPGTDRPRRAIVVATQVVEQSLDIDFDLLVSDLAPIDLIIQRIGRLHRHQRGPDQSDRPERLRTARCVVVGVEDWTHAPPRADRGSRTIYGAHLLLRTAAVMLEQIEASGTFVAPDDVARCVQRVYGDQPIGPASWHGAMGTAEAKSEKRRAGRVARAQTYLLHPPRRGSAPIIDWVGSGGSTDDEHKGAAVVRDGEDSIEVIVVKRVDGELRLVDGIDGDPGHPLADTGPMHPDQALLVANSTARLPGYLSVGKTADALIDELATHYYPEWQRNDQLAGRLVLELDRHQRASCAGMQFSYDALTGLEASKHD